MFEGLRRSLMSALGFGSPVQRQASEPGVPVPAAPPRAKRTAAELAGEGAAIRLALEGDGKLEGGADRTADYLEDTGDWELLRLSYSMSRRLNLGRNTVGNLRARGIEPPGWSKQETPEVVPPRRRPKGEPRRDFARRVAAVEDWERAKAREDDERIISRADALREELAAKGPGAVLHAISDMWRDPDRGQDVIALLDPKWRAALEAKGRPYVTVEEHRRRSRNPADWMQARVLCERAAREGQALLKAARKGLLEATGMDDYLAFFPEARALHRQFTFHVGPTNSGKTHAAMEVLRQARKGIYLAPLRLLALEGYDKLVSSGLDAALVTGDDSASTAETPTHVSATVEMLDTSEVSDVAVIDEVQMLADPGRGWAWTRAIVGAAARQVVRDSGRRTPCRRWNTCAG